MAQVSLRDTFGDLLVELGEKITNIVVIDVDLSGSTRTSKFAQKFPNRFFNMGIAEQNAMGSAIGFALANKIPIISGFSIFNTGRAWEFIRSICHDNLNVKIVVTHAGFVGEDGSSHNDLEDLTLMATIPNMTVLVPLDGIELEQMLKYMIKSKGPFYIRLPRGIFQTIHQPSYNFKLGFCDILKEGNELCFIGTGYGSILAYNSASLIEEELSTSIKVIHLPSIKPIDELILVNHLKNLKGIVVVEEHNIYCGFGSILARIISEKLQLPMKFVGVEDAFIESGKREILWENYGLSYSNLRDKAKSLLL